MNPLAQPATASVYRGRIAPTPSGPLHLGHALTFWTAQQRALASGGALVLRNEDLDPDRCQPQYAAQMLSDLHWFGLRWQEGPDVGGPYAPYVQSQRLSQYLDSWRALAAAGAIYASPHSRKDIAAALVAPHEEPHDNGEPAEQIFPAALRPAEAKISATNDPGAVNWRFRVPDGEVIAFDDGRHGRVERTAGVDFGDFLIWRKDGFPSYELAVMHDDHAMHITEVVRGEDLLTSTARQLLLYRALGWNPPAFYHCPLVRDERGQRLAKRTDAVSLAALRASGRSPEELRGRA
jgi:glutamyl/glutaminyl-tRNA synthetase